jgi:3-phosphoshikimate 1-carboxyvinyltransferase
MTVKIDIIPSKSYAHRLFIASALSGEETIVRCSLRSADIEATRACIEALRKKETDLPCGESASTLRFLLPVAAALGRHVVFHVEGSLVHRPLSPLREELEAHGCSVSAEGSREIEISGQLEAGTFTIPGNVSSQFVTGLLLALPLLPERSIIEIPGRLGSASFVGITIDVLKKFGVRVREEFNDEDDPGAGRRYFVPGGQEYHGPRVCTVEGDWSAAAFWMTAGAVGPEPVMVRGLNLFSKQGDRQMVSILRKFGADVTEHDESVTVTREQLHGIEVNVSDCPDLAPAIAVAAAFAAGDTRITGAGRLRLKECDRLSAICSVLNELGGRAEEGEDNILIHGGDGAPLAGGRVSSFGDHRIAMMEAVLSLISRDPVSIDGSGAVAKSYPGFFEEWTDAGFGERVEAL